MSCRRLWHVLPSLPVLLWYAGRGGAAPGPWRDGVRPISRAFRVLPGAPAGQQAQTEVMRIAARACPLTSSADRCSADRAATR